MLQGGVEALVCRAQERCARAPRQAGLQPSPFTSLRLIGYGFPFAEQRERESEIERLGGPAPPGSISSCRRIAASAYESFRSNPRPEWCSGPRAKGCAPSRDPSLFGPSKPKFRHTVAHARAGIYAAACGFYQTN
jgi:hypothetical protein